MSQYEVVFVYKDSPADKAGIRPGDIVLSLDNVPIKNRYQAFKIYDDKYPGNVMTIKFKRQEKVFVENVKLESHHVLYPYYVLMELINKDIPIRLAFFVHEIKSENMNEQDMLKWKSFITSAVVGSLEGDFIKKYRGQNNFAIVDRTQTEVVLQELVFQQSGLVPSDLQSKLVMLGATHLFIVNLSVFESINTRYSTMRLIEVESGKILSTATIREPIYEEKIYSIRMNLLNYLNSDLKQVSVIEKEAIMAFSNVTGPNFRDDEALYNALVKVIIPKYETLTQLLMNVAPSTEELKNIHRLYVQGANLQLKAFQTFKMALENSDKASVNQANDTLASGRMKIEGYQLKMRDLFKKYELNIQTP